jgi:hypothetical protein
MSRSGHESEAIRLKLRGMEFRPCRAWLVLVAVAAVASAGALAACYAPGFRDCQFSCDGEIGCPEGLICVTGECRTTATPATTCLAGGGDMADGSLTDGPEPSDDSSTPTIDSSTPTIDSSTPTIDAAVPPPIDAAVPPVDAGTCDCDPLGGQSCCGGGKSCDVVGDDAVCRAVTLSGQQAAPCTSATQCAPGYSCMNGTCHEFCDADGDCMGGGGLCELPIADWQACTSACDPLSSSGCQTDWACTIGKRPGGTRWTTDCRVEGASALGAPCSADTQCERGLVCAGSPKRCARYCNSGQSGGSGCPGTPTCVFDSSSPVIGGITWGACL